MCGLAGFQTTRSRTLPAAEMAARAAAMIGILHHRGPDGSAEWVRGDVALAHARLAIIDTSASANQPMHDAEDAVHVVFNGELYNFQSVRRELEALGHRFRTQGDTEVIVEGYRAWGEGVFDRIAGMFAIAIWDERRRRLVLARDRMGEKPLCYAERADGFLFASEIKALLTWPGMERVPDREQLHHYLTFGFVSGEQSAFKGIKRLPPAHIMTVEEGRITGLRRYWSLPHPSEQAERDPAALREELIEVLTESVRGCLIADVPLGAFLSGGVDSSAVVAMVAGRLGRQRVETFSSGFGRGDYDETAFAAQVADRYGTQHHAFRFGTALLRDTSRLAWHYDEPFSDSSSLVAFALARETRKRVTVALTGDGADETFLGYARYFRYGAMIRGEPGARRPGRRLPGLYRRDNVAGAEARQAATDAYGYLMERFREHQKVRLYDLALMPHLRGCSYEQLLPHFVECASPEEQAARFDVGLYLPDDLLVKIDIAAMAHSLETRAPFLQHSVVEFAARIPAHQRVWDGEGKALLKQALEPWLPHECLYRPKVGFRVPVAHFMRELARQQTRDLLLSERFLDRGIVQRDYIRTLLDDHVAGREEHGTRLWSLVMLELWFRTWVDSESNQPLSDNADPFVEFGRGRWRDHYGDAPAEAATAA